MCTLLRPFVSVSTLVGPVVSAAATLSVVALLRSLVLIIRRNITLR
jgi:hypothetical protein